MDKVLVIDDEKWVSEVIKMIIPWEDYRFTVTRCCTNGLEALQAVREEKPSLVFTDIRMPGMDGIEFLKQMSVYYPEIICVVISGYNDFEYAKSALTYGAIGYLLKPIDEEELKQIVIKARSTLDDKESQNQENRKIQERYEATIDKLRNAYFYKILSGDTVPKRQYLNYELKYNFKAANFQMIFFWHGSEDSASLVEIISRALWKGQLPSRCYEVAVFEYYNKAVCLFNYGFQTENDFSENRDAFVRQIVARNQGLVSYVGGEFDDFSLINAKYRELKQIEPLRILRDGERIFYLSKNKGYTRGPDILSPGLSFELARKVSDDDRDGLIRLIGSSLDQVVKQAGFNPVVFYYGISELIAALSSVDGSIKDDTEMVFDRASDIADIRKSLESYADILLSNKANEQTERVRSVTEKVMEYIDSAYMNNISLTDVSEKYHLNPNYLSDIFRKNAGVTFKEYLTNTRMNAAKKLLRDTNHKIAAIASMTGYNDVKNFSRIFKKYVGISPAEYRNLMG